MTVRVGYGVGKCVAVTYVVYVTSLLQNFSKILQEFWVVLQEFCEILQNSAKRVECASMG
jgi:hypothetical protein